VNNRSKSIIRIFSPRLVLLNISKLSEVSKVSPAEVVALWRGVVPGKEEISSPLPRPVFLTCEDCVDEHLFQNKFHLSQFHNFPTPGSHLFEYFLGKLWLRTAAEIVGIF
jgi:hypothetical protein